jgi:hypothetical protein
VSGSLQFFGACVTRRARANAFLGAISKRGCKIPRRSDGIEPVKATF